MTELSKNQFAYKGVSFIVYLKKQVKGSGVPWVSDTRGKK